MYMNLGTCSGKCVFKKYEDKPDNCDSFTGSLFEPPHGKTNNLHMRKQRRRSASRKTAKLISAFVFAPRIVQFLFYLNPKFQASSSFLCLYRPVCVGPVRKPHCWFSHEVAHLLSFSNFSGLLI